MEPIIQDLSGSVRKSFPLAGLELRTELTNVDEELCRRCAGIRPVLYAVLYIGSAGGNRDEAPVQVSELFADPFFETMQAGESAAMGLSGTHAAVAQLDGFIVGSDGLSAGGSRHPFHEARPGSPRISGFHVFLPCAIAPDEDSARPVTAEAAGETILLVDNEPLVRELSRDMLEKQGYRVILAADAIEAEQISGGAGSFDLLITDAVMPTITGMELARRLRTAHPGLKVLFISGYEDGRAKRNETGTEGAAFLQKPFSAESLGRKIRQMLSRAN
jgi:CheY-like chemotaxis protein